MPRPGPRPRDAGHALEEAPKRDPRTGAVLAGAMGSADITLRHVVRSHPEALVQALDIPGHVEVVGWLDTQVTALERRLDKALGLLVDGELCALQTEFKLCLRRSAWMGA